MQFTTDGLVIREVNVGENDKMLTILTPERGRIGVMAKGSRSLKSQVLSTEQLYTYGNYEIYEKNDFMWLRSGSVIEGFFGLRNDIELISLAAYIADVAWELSGEDIPAVDMLRMTLNAFYALANRLKDPAIVKGVYELRSAGFSGFMPDVIHCRYCKKDTADRFYLDVMNGSLLCCDCIKVKNHPLNDEIPEYDKFSTKNILFPLTNEVLMAIRYSINASPKRLFSFALKSDDDIRLFSRAGETYLQNHLERGFDTLEFYRSVSADVPSFNKKYPLKKGLL